MWTHFLTHDFRANAGQARREVGGSVVPKVPLAWGGGVLKSGLQF
jgi:hypothetical protein